MFTRTMIAQELFMNVTDLIGDNALPISHGKKQLWLNAKVCGGNCSLDAQERFPPRPLPRKQWKNKKAIFLPLFLSR